MKATTSRPAQHFAFPCPETELLGWFMRLVNLLQGWLWRPEPSHLNDTFRSFLLSYEAELLARTESRGLRLTGLFAEVDFTKQLHCEPHLELVSRGVNRGQHTPAPPC